MSLRRGSATHRVVRVVAHASVGIGLLLVFVSGSLLALVLYGNLPAGRRIIALALQQTLTRTFEGGFEVSSVDRVSLVELRARGITVHDPDGHLVLSVSALSVSFDLPDLVQKLVFGVGPVTLRFAHARIEHAEVYLLPRRKDNVPTIVDAFTPTPSRTGSGPSTSSPIKVWLPEIEIGHLYGRMALEGVPTLETELSSVRGSVVGSSALTSVDVERFSALVRGLAGADATGVGSVHVRAPGAVWTSFDGYLGDVQLGTVVRVDSPKLDIRLDVPRAVPSAVRALWGGYPVQQDVGAHIEAQGTLAVLQTQAKLTIGKGSLTSSGELRLAAHPGADLELSGRGLDLRAIWPTAPTTELDADSSLSVFRTGSDWVAEVSGSTRATTLLGTQLPSIDLNGTYSANGFTAHGVVHEPGAPVDAALDVHLDGSIDLTAEAKRVRLEKTPRLQPYFAGKGTLDLKVKARIDKGRVVAQVNGVLDELRYGELSVKSNKFSGRASGPLDALEKLSLDLSVGSQALRAGALGFDQLETKVSGPLTRPLISTKVTNQQGPLITAQATLSTRGNPQLENLSLDLHRDQAALSARVQRVEFNGDAVRVRDFVVEGAGGKLGGTVELAPGRLALVAHGSDLDLSVMAHALGLPRGVISGTARVDADLESSSRTQRGVLELKLEHGASEGVAIESLAVSGKLNGSQLDLQTQAALPTFGNFSGQARAILTGSLADRRTYEQVTGVLTVKAEHVPFDLLRYLIPKSAHVTEVRGEGSAVLVLDRSDRNQFPNASLIANTSGLYVGLEARGPNEKPTAFDSVEAHAGLNLKGDSGQTDLTLKLDDRHGPLLSATTQLTLDLKQAAARALAHPDRLLAQLRATPLVAKLVVEDRPLEELPAPLVPKGIAGRLRTVVSLSGTVDHPVFSGKLALNRLRLGDSERDKAIDVCAQLDYDKTSGQYGARGELFQPTAGSHACLGSRVAQFSAAGRAEWAKLVSSTLSADPAWTGAAGLSLEGLPLGIVPSFAEASLDGRVFGVVMFDRREALPQIRSQLEVRDAVIARTRLGTAAIQAQTDGRSLTGTLSIQQPATGPNGVALQGGTLTASVQSFVNWQGVVPGIDDTRPISASVKARNVDAVILTPIVRDVLSEIGGKLDANLTATLTPNLNANPVQPYNFAVRGSLSMRDGTLQLERLALRMRNVSGSASAEPHDNSTLITINSLTAAAEADKPNLAARGNLWLSGFRVVKGNANVTVQGVPLLVEGVTLATLNGRAIAIELERKPTEMFVALTIAELEAKLPQEASRSLIALSKNPNILIAQPIAQPSHASDSESLPWRLRFDLGNRVKVTRSDLFLPISGSPELLLGDELGILGDIDLRSGGRLNLPGLPRPFTIENGTVYFDPGAEPGNPRLRVRAVCQLSQLTVWATVTGTFRDADVLFESDDPTLNTQAQIEAALLSAPTDSGSPATAGLGAGAGYLGKQLLANTALANLELKAGSETTADQKSYATYSAAYPITDELWFEGSYKTLQNQDLSGTNSNAFSGTFDWRFRRNWSLRTEVGNIGAGVDLLWLYRY